MIGIALPLSDLLAQAPPAAPPPSPPPKTVFLVKDRHGHATPTRTEHARTGGGNTDVAQPREDTLVITMTGVAAAGPHPFETPAADIDFDLDQNFEIAFADPKLKNAKLSVEAQIIGLLRGDANGGTASMCSGAVVITCGDISVLDVSMDGHAVTGDDHLAINDRKGPYWLSVTPGEFHLVQKFHISAAHVRGICGRAAAAEFAPDPALDPTWISVKDPFHGANKKEFGFRVILRIEPEEGAPLAGKSPAPVNRAVFLKTTRAPLATPASTAPAKEINRSPAPGVIPRVIFSVPQTDRSPSEGRN
jgi:hypothetical protein